jgi:hypothetical protein
MPPDRPMPAVTRSSKGAIVILRIVSGVLIVAALSLPSSADPRDKVPGGQVPGHAKRHAKTAWHGYGFLPGYRPPEQIARDRSGPRTGHYFYGYPGYNFYGGPGFYQGRWNGGGFGPCWTQTPIGPHWNCG